MHAHAGPRLPVRGRTGSRAAETPKHQRPLSTGQPLWIRGGMSSASLEVLQIDKYDRHNVDSSRKAARSPAAHVARSTQIGATALISRSAAPPVSDLVPPTVTTTRRPGPGSEASRRGRLIKKLSPPRPRQALARAKRRESVFGFFGVRKDL